MVFFFKEKHFRLGKMTPNYFYFQFFISEQLKYNYPSKDLFNILKQISYSHSSLLCHKMGHNNLSSSKHL